MDIIRYIITNWYMIFAIATLSCFIIFIGLKFLGLPMNSQKKKIIEWLVWACTEAEKDLGSSTGQLKLRKVYDMFLLKFPMTAKLIKYETFSKWVDLALVKMKEMLENNKSIKALIIG